MWSQPGPVRNWSAQGDAAAGEVDHVGDADERRKQVIEQRVPADAAAGRCREAEGASVLCAHGHPRPRRLHPSQAVEEILAKKFDLQRASVANFISRQMGETFVEINGMIQLKDDAMIVFPE